jgi:hypothetical protein
VVYLTATTTASSPGLITVTSERVVTSLVTNLAVSSPTSADDPKQTTSNVGSSTGLSKGAIAGIVIGALALLAAIGVAIFLLLRRRRSAHSGVDESVAKGTQTDAKSELAATPDAAQIELEAPGKNATHTAFPVELSSEEQHTRTHFPEVNSASDQARTSRLADIKAEARELEEKMARMRHPGALKEEHARM